MSGCECPLLRLSAVGEVDSSRGLERLPSWRRLDIPVLLLHGWVLWSVIHCWSWVQIPKSKYSGTMSVNQEWGEPAVPSELQGERVRQRVLIPPHLSVCMGQAYKPCTQESHHSSKPNARIWVHVRATRHPDPMGWLTLCCWEKNQCRLFAEHCFVCLYWLTGHGKFQLSLVSGSWEVMSVDFTLYLCLEVFCWQIGLFVPSQGTKSVVGFHTTIRQFFLFPKNKEIYEIYCIINM